MGSSGASAGGGGAHPDLATHDTLGLATDSEVFDALALKAPLASPTFTGVTTAPEYSTSGLTGATAAARWVGATTSGPPTSGTFAVGDFVVSHVGRIWVCVTAGTPGTWAGMGVGPSYGAIMRSGEDTWPVFSGTAAAAFGVGDMRCIPFHVPRPITAIRIGAKITSAGGAGSLARLGIYADDGTGKPGSLILDAGTIDGTVLGLGLITISQALPAGLIWLSYVAQVAAPTVQYALAAPLQQPYSATDTNTQGWQKTAVTGALPASGSTFVRVSNPVLVTLRAS